MTQALELCYQADHLHRTATEEGEYHHRFTLAAARIGILLQSGEYRRADSELQAYLREAEATENISAELHINMAQVWADINAARARPAIAMLDRQRAQLPQLGFGLLHFMHMVAVLRIGCATGEYDWALDTTREPWQTYQRSVVRRSRGFAMYAFEVHARVVLARCVHDGTQKDAARLVAADLKGLSSVKLESASAEIARIRARLSIFARDVEAARRWLETSNEHFEKVGQRDQIARNRCALGLMRGDEAGQALVRECCELMAQQGIVDPRDNLFGYFPELL